MNKKAIWVVITLVLATILVIGGVYALTKKDPSSTETTDNTSQQNSDQTQTTDKKAALTIVYTDSGFEKSEYTVKAGDVVQVKNNSSTDVQFSSGNHPTHTLEPELNLTVLSPGQSATFTPTRVGQWSFHNHLNEQHTGTLIVQ